MSIRISNISYLNTLPFRYGLKHHKFPAEFDVRITEDIPSVCAQKIKDGKADIGIIPVGALPGLKEYHIISDFCIASLKRVESVELYAQTDLKNLRRIYLDYQSRTSVKLLQFLAKNKWKIDVEWLSAEPGYENNISGNTGGLIIGDRALELSSTFSHKYDLAEEWHQFTGRPFVFAVWVSTIKPDPRFVAEFNEALKYGINHIDEAISEFPSDLNIDISYYLRNNIYYKLDNSLRESIDYFLREAFPDK